VGCHFKLILWFQNPEVVYYLDGITLSVPIEDQQQQQQQQQQQEEMDNANYVEVVDIDTLLTPNETQKV
jgi:hypothetical protein